MTRPHKPAEPESKAMKVPKLSQTSGAILVVGCFWGHPQARSPRTALAACLLYPHHRQPHMGTVVSLMDGRWQDG